MPLGWSLMWVYFGFVLRQSVGVLKIESIRGIPWKWLQVCWYFESPNACTFGEKLDFLVPQGHAPLAEVCFPPSLLDPDFLPNPSRLQSHLSSPRELRNIENWTQGRTFSHGRENPKNVCARWNTSAQLSAFAQVREKGKKSFFSVGNKKIVKESFDVSFSRVFFLLPSVSVKNTWKQQKFSLASFSSRINIPFISDYDSDFVLLV